MANTDDFETDDIDVTVEAEEDSAPQPVKKRGGGFVKIILVLAVLAGGFFAFRQFGAPLLAQLTGSAAPETPVSQAAEAVAGVVAEAPAPAAAPAATEEPIAEISVVPSGTEAPAETATAETPAAPADPLSWNNEAAPAETPVDPSAPAVDAQAEAPVEAGTDPAPAEISVDPSAPVMPAAIPAPVEAPVAEAAVDSAAAVRAAETPVTESTTGPAAVSAETALNAPVAPSTEPEPSVPVAPQSATAATDDQVSLRMEALEKRLNSIDEAVISLQQDLATKSDIDALKEALAKLEENQKSAPAPAEKTAAPVVGEEETAAPEIKPEEVKEAEAPAQVQKAKPVAKKPVQKKAAPAVSSRWVLKSAKPGTAWVAEAGSGEMKTVTVGDSLSGIGIIRSISQNSTGRWVVNGSKGQINQ